MDGLIGRTMCWVELAELLCNHALVPIPVARLARLALDKSPFSKLPLFVLGGEQSPVETAPRFQLRVPGASWPVFGVPWKTSVPRPHEV